MVRQIASVIILLLYLGVHNGQMALFRHGDPTPAECYPLQIRMLPIHDQLDLTRGIEILDSGHLARLLEDYLS